jgi:hypothetical protein
MELLSKIPKKDKNCAWRIIDGEAVVMSLESQLNGAAELIILNQTATRIWELCNGRRSARDIVSLLAKEYSGGREVIENQVQEAIEKMLKEKLIIA